MLVEKIGEKQQASDAAGPCGIEKLWPGNQGDDILQNKNTLTFHRYISCNQRFWTLQLYTVAKTQEYTRVFFDPIWALDSLAKLCFKMILHLWKFSKLTILYVYHTRTPGYLSAKSIITPKKFGFCMNKFSLKKTFYLYSVLYTLS